ncbi:MAG: hypothetical protein QOG37_1582, partial [Mycobacterium sp.]|nr:hypothetical protein [Mycobacterium sp.]
RNSVAADIHTQPAMKGIHTHLAAASIRNRPTATRSHLAEAANNRSHRQVAAADSWGVDPSQESPYPG